MPATTLRRRGAGWRRVGPPPARAGSLRHPGGELAPLHKGHGEILVFATAGERSELNGMSGGDYDGNSIAVKWDETLMPRRTRPWLVLRAGQVRAAHSRGRRADRRPLRRASG